MDTLYHLEGDNSKYIKKQKNLISIADQLVVFNSDEALPEIDFYIFSKDFYLQKLKNHDPRKCIFDSSVKPEWVLQNNPNFAQAHFVQRDGAFVNKIE